MRKYEMTFIAATDRHGPRWRKIYKGKIYYFPAGRGKTDRDAYSAALDAWDRKRREVDGEPIPEPPRPIEEVIGDAAQAYAEAAWPTALAQLQANHRPVADQVTAFLRDKETRVSPGRLTALRIHLKKFTDWLGSGYDVRAIDGPTLLRYRQHVDATCKRRTAGHRLEAVKTWMRWLYGAEVISALPRAMSTRDLAVRKSTPAIRTYAVEQVKQLLSKASPRTKLYIVLALNCGMTQADVSALLKSEIDLLAGTVTRRRTKTRDEESVPVVVYRLWPATAALLRQELAEDGPLALLGEKGRPLLRVGATTKTDVVRSAFNRLLKKTGLTGSYKLLRKTSATLLADSAWPDTYDLFLGHAAGKVSDRHYAQAAQGRLGEALAWLGTQFGL